MKENQSRQEPVYIEFEAKVAPATWLLLIAQISAHYNADSLPFLNRLVYCIAVLLMVWILLIFYWKYTNRTEEPIIYRRAPSSDYWKIFFICYLACPPLTVVSQTSFVFFGIVIILLSVLHLTIAICDSVIHKMITPLTIGCLVFIYINVSRQEKRFLQHYGVPIIGHFLEKSNYNTQHQVKAKLGDNSDSLTLLADINVIFETKTFDAGVDRYGQEKTKSFKYRNIWVKRLQLPNGSWIEVASQDNPLSLKKGAYVYDNRGRIWYIQMTNLK